MVPPHMSPHLNALPTMMRPLDANLYVKVGKHYSLLSDPYPEYTSPSTSPQLAPPLFFDTVNSSTLEPCVPSPVESNTTRTNSELCTNDSLMQHSLVQFAFPVPPDDGLGFFSWSASIDSCLSRNSLKTPASSPSNVPRNPHLEELIDEEASFGCVSDVYEDSWSISVSTPCYTNTPSCKSHCRTFSSEFFEESHSFSAAISSSTPAFNVPCEKVVPPKSPTVELMDDTLMSSTSFPPPTVALPGEEAVLHDPLTMEPIGDTPVSFGGSPDFGDDSYRLSPVLPAHSEPRSRFLFILSTAVLILCLSLVPRHTQVPATTRIHPLTLPGMLNFCLWQVGISPTGSNVLDQGAMKPLRLILFLQRPISASLAHHIFHLALFRSLRLDLYSESLAFEFCHAGSSISTNINSTSHCHCSVFTFRSSFSIAFLVSLCFDLTLLVYNNTCLLFIDCF
jgi:hypothetical protein